MKEIKILIPEMPAVFDWTLSQMPLLFQEINHKDTSAKDIFNKAV